MPLLINTNSTFPQEYRFRAPELSTTPTLSREQMDALSQRIYNRTYETNAGVGAWEHIGRFALGTAIDTADSVWSTPLNPFGERGDVWSLASQEQKEYFERNKSMIETASAVTGGILTAVAAEALLIPRLTAAMASSTALTNTAIWRAAAKWNNTTRVNMLAAQRAAAESGEAFGIFTSSAGRAYLANRAAAGAATALRTVPLEYALMWNNEVFNSGDAATEGFWIGAAAALGGTIGTIGARATVRRVANSDEIKNIRGQNFALAGVSNDLLSPDYLSVAQRIDPTHVEMKESAYTTEFLIGSRAASPEGYATPAPVATRQNKLRDEMRSLAADSLQKIVAKGITGIDTVKLPVKDLPEIRNIIDNVAKTDPFVLHGLAEMGVTKTSIKAAKEERDEFIKSLWKQSEVMNKKGNIKEAQRLARLQRQLKQQEDYVFINGSWVGSDSKLAEAVVSFKPERARSVVANVKGTEGVKVTIPSGGKIQIDASLSPRDGRGAAINVESMQLQDRLFLNEATNSLIGKLTAKNAKIGFKLTDSALDNWYTLDVAAEVLERGGKVEFATTKAKLESVDDLRRKALQIKARKLLAEVGPTGRITDEHRFRYNLPMSTAMERLDDSAGDGFRAWLKQAADDAGSMREFAAALSEYRAIQGIDLLPPQGAPLPRVDGDMFRFNRDKDGNWLRPMLGYFDPKNKIQKIAQRGHSEAMMLRKAETTAKLLKGDTMVNQLARDLVAMPELAKAMEVAKLARDQITGLGGGLGQLLGEVLPKRFRWRDSDTILAASKAYENAEKRGLSNFQQLMQATKMQDEVTLITSSGHAPQRAMLDQYFSLRSGWDIEEMVPMGDGMYGFRLADTELNRRRLGLEAGEEWGDALLMNERLNKPIVVDEIGSRIIQKFNQITDAIREADNALRAAKGLKPIERRAFYTPPPDTRGALVGFVFGPDDKLVPGRTIVARSQEEYNKLVNRTLDELGANSGYTIRNRSQLESLRDIWDEAAMDWIDPGISSATAGVGSQKGGLTGAYVKSGAFTEALDWVKKKSIVQSQDTLRTMMNEPILVARAMGAAERAANPSIGRTIFDEYEMALTGKSKAFLDSSYGDWTLRKVEESIDRILANSAITVPARHIVDLAQRIGMNPMDINGKRTYREIAKAMGPYTPYANAVEFLESRGIRRPPTVRGAAQVMNTVATAVLLRWLELPHAMMNVLGLIATVPATVMSGRAPISTFIDVKGQRLGLVDGSRIISQAMKDMVSKRGTADWNYMERMGDSGQSAIEYHRAMGEIQSQAGFMKWLKKADKMASLATDTSENWSRQYAHFVGLRLADYHGIQGMAARHDFAREIANAAIADYSPINRPELFGSGLGTMFGLFQSYVLNHYTKMFRWLETGQFKEAGLQAAIQASMFGLGGTYGLGHLFDLRDSLLTSSGEPTFTDLVYERFGPVLGGAISHGSISEITQLALWTRGDMNFRVPAVSGTLPAIDVGTRVARGFVDGVKAFLNAMPGEGTHAVMEVVQREMPNRVLKSWLILANGGREIDAYGQVMTETTEWLDTVARSIGVRSRRQQVELEAFYEGKAAMERDAARMEKVRESFRAAVRNNSGDLSKVDPIQYFNRYVEAGGNPRMFRTWVKNLMRDADNPRSAQQLRKSLMTPKAALSTWRYGAYGAWEVRE